MESVAEGIRAATEAIRGLSKVAGRPVSKHVRGHVGEKQRRKERTRAKNRVARTSRKANR